VVGVVAVVVLTLVLAAAARNRGHGPGDTRTVSVAADSVRTVDLQGPPGQLNIVALRTSRVTLSGPVHWTGRSAVIVTGPRLVNGVLHLGYRCAAHSPCTGRLRLTVPQRCGIVLRQPSGHVIVTGLAGPLRISARSVDISATGLRSPSLAASITSGHLSAWFVSAPGQVGLALDSAQAALHLPATTGSASRSPQGMSTRASRKPATRTGRSPPGSTPANSSCSHAEPRPAPKAGPGHAQQPE
jgi:hypothetical protein